MPSAAPRPSRPAVAGPPDDRRAWEALLHRRDHPKWSSLSWLALRPLISAANDMINGYAPELVGDLRRAWVERQRADGRWPSLTASDGVAYDGVVDRRRADAFVLLGDTGEQDASQYALVPELRRVAAALPADAFALICSDVIYPSGDVNDYVHALYLPYGPRPDGPGLADDPLARLDILALPGNHDWYDGLAGFMFHFCGRNRLPRTIYGWRRGITFTEAVARLVWRRPSRPRPARLWAPLSGGEGPVVGPHTRARPLADLRHERGLGDLQPGPYYAVEMRHQLLVCIDTGIARDGRTVLDPDQSAWLARVSRHPKPKLLLTGTPLRVDLAWKPCLLTGPAAVAHGDVHAVVRDPAHRYLAVIGGDIHNYQSYAPEPGTGIRYLVSGGGGAFLSATHPLALVEERTRPTAVPATPAHGSIAPDVGGPVTPHPTPNSDTPISDTPGQKTAPHVRDPEPAGGAMLGLDGLYPSDVESLQRFGRILVLRLWRFQRALAAFLVGLAAALIVGPLAGPRPPVGDDRLDVTLASAGGLVAIMAAGRFLLPVPAGATASPPYRAVVVAWVALVGATMGLALWWLDPGRARWNGAVWAGLTAGGCLLAHLMRESSWWRTARPSDPPLRPWIVPVGAVAWVGAAGGAAVLRAPITLATLVLLAAVAVGGWYGRRARGRRGEPWNATAARLAYAAQGATALAAASEILVRPSTGWHPLLVVAGLAAAAAAALGALVVAAVVIVALAWLTAVVAGLTTRSRPTARAPTRFTWREAYGILGFLGPWLAAAGAVGGPIVALARTTGPGTSHPHAGGVVLAAMAIASGTVASIILLDTLRRWFPGTYKPVNAVVVTGSSIAVWWLFHGTWALRGLLTALVAVVLAVLTAVLVNLTFLRTWALLADTAVHREGATVFTDDEARQVLAWRRSADDRQAPTSPAIRRRGRIVFPSAYQPRGPIQAKVSEFFDNDNPPFAKNLLVIRTDAEAATITAQPVDGLGPLPPIEVLRLPFPAGTTPGA